MNELAFVAVKNRLYIRDVPACEDCSNCAAACASIEQCDFDCAACVRSSPACELNRRVCHDCAVVDGQGFAWRLLGQRVLWAMQQN